MKGNYKSLKEKTLKVTKKTQHISNKFNWKRTYKSNTKEKLKNQFTP